MEARAVALAAAVPLSGIVEEALISAETEANAVVAALGDKAKELGLEAAVAPAPAAPAPTEKEEEAEEEEEEEKEEEVDLSEGLGGLFGM